MSAKCSGNYSIARPAGLAVAFVAFLAASAFVAAQTAVTTYHNDNNRTGWNKTESVLTPANVGAATFGLLQNITLDDQVDAQPLVVPGVMITAGNYVGVHDVVYVATENNSIYAIDIHTGTVLLTANFGTPVPMPLGCNNNGPNVGINGTPVIDLSSNTLYVMIYTQDTTGPAYRLHALALGSLTDKVTPQLVTASHPLADGSTFNFNAKYQRQRPGLLLANGSVYAGFGSFCDYSANLSRGWLLGWTAGSLTPFPANNLNDRQVTSPDNFFLSSIWMSGYAPAADDSGNVLFVTGNSDPSGATYDGITNIQESVVKVPSTLGTVSDLFTPMNQSSLDKGDADFGSGGALVLPDQPGLTYQLAVAAGKDGNMYLMDEDNLGGYSTTKNNVIATYSIGGCWCGESYFVDSDGVGRVVSSGNSTIQVWKLATSPTVSLTNTTSGSISNGQDPGFFTSISSNGTSNPIIWALSRPATSNNGAPISLYAFNPDSGGGAMTNLFSSPAGNWPNMGGNANLVPVVANGLVFVASNQQLQIFGLTATPAGTTTTLTSSVNPSIQGKSVTFTATVIPQSGSGIPAGTVTFQNGATVLGKKPLTAGTVTFITQALPPGSDSITAVYGGSSTFTASTSSPLNQFVQATTTTVVTSSLPTQSSYGQTVLFSATVSSSIGAPPNGETITFAQGTKILGTGTLSGGVATFSDSTLPKGTQAIKAVYPGDANFATSTSKPFDQLVVPRHHHNHADLVTEPVSLPTVRNLHGNCGPAIHRHSHGCGCIFQRCHEAGNGYPEQRRSRLHHHKINSRHGDDYGAVSGLRFVPDQHVRAAESGREPGQHHHHPHFVAEPVEPRQLGNLYRDRRRTVRRHGDRIGYIHERNHNPENGESGRGRRKINNLNATLRNRHHHGNLQRQRKLHHECGPADADSELAPPRFLGRG